MGTAHPAAPSDGEPRPGAPIGPYDLLTLVGTGGMAQVWAARVRATGQVVALKLLLPEVAENESFQQMFFDEACIASRVRHRNVCETYELAHENGSLYLAMEWVDGPSLMRLLRPAGEEEGDSPKIPIDPRIAAKIVADACGGLHAAHNLRGPDGRHLEVVHRDVSPHNVLVGTDGSVKVTDFGVAKALGKSHMTLAGQIKGKLAYMSPEQLMGGGLDRRSDVFALGTVLYEITTGQKPFTGEHDPQVMAAIVMGNYQLPSELVPGYPAALEQIVVRALANEPSDRFATAQDMQRALESWLAVSGPAVLPAHVAMLVRERCGAESEARARALNDAMRSVRNLSAVDTAGGGVAVERRSGPKTSGYAGAIAAVLVGTVLGLGVLGYVWTTKRAKATVARPDVSAVVSAAPVAVAPPEPAATVAAAATQAALPGGTVHVKVDPPTALLIVEGTVLPRGVDRLARPEDGGSVQVVVRAEGHEDTIVLVDDATPDEVEVALLPITPQRAAVRPRARDAGAVTAAASAAPPGAPDEAPPNPY